MQKPSGIDLTAALMGLFIVLDIVLTFLMPTPPMPASAQNLPMGTIMAAAKGFALFAAVLSAVFVYFYWKGYNWARWLVMIDAVLVLLSLFKVPGTMRLFPVAGVLAIVKALLAAYLLYYLNTPVVKAWFSKAPVTYPPDAPPPPTYVL